MAIAAWSTDRAPAANVDITAGWVVRASARRTTSLARCGETPACHVNQWASDVTPQPCHDPVASGFGGQLDELGVEHVEVTAHGPQPLLDVGHRPRVGRLGKGLERHRP